MTGLFGLKNLSMIKLYNKKRFACVFLSILTKNEKLIAIFVKCGMKYDVISNIIE